MLKGRLLPTLKYLTESAQSGLAQMNRLRSAPVITVDSLKQASFSLPALEGAF